MRVAVVGGGVSGMRAALTLARAGVRVSLFEKNRHLGGRVLSFATPDFGEIDLGQHIWLRACTATEQLLRDLEVPDDWVFRQERVAMTYRWPDGEVRTLASGRLPGWLGMAPFLARARLSLADKARFARGMLRAGRLSEAEVERLDGLSFADWLARERQPADTVAWIWGPFVVGVCNMPLEKVSARHGLFAVRESLLKSARASAICFLRRPLSDVFDRQARPVLGRAGVEMRHGAAVRGVRGGRRGADPVVLEVDGGRQEAFDRAVLAASPAALRRLLPEDGLAELPGGGAIAGLVVKFARPVMDELFFSAVGSPVQVVFNKSAIWRRPEADGGQVLELVISAAEREARLGVEAVAAEQLAALAMLLPRVRETSVVARRLVVHGGATFLVPPGGEARRYALVRPERPGVVRAGEYAATGWPSTMESAARAGEAAARIVLEDGPGPA